MWAFTTLTAHDIEFLAAVRHGTMCAIWEISLQTLADTVWAIAMLAIHDEELLEAVWRGAKCKL